MDDGRGCGLNLFGLVSRFRVVLIFSGHEVVEAGGGHHPGQTAVVLSTATHGGVGDDPVVGSLVANGQLVAIEPGVQLIEPMGLGVNEGGLMLIVIAAGTYYQRIVLNVVFQEILYLQRLQQINLLTCHA